MTPPGTTTAPEHLARVALTTIAIGSCLGLPLGIVGAAGVNILANLVQSHWSTICGILWQTTTAPTADPIDAAIHTAIARAVDRARDNYREEPTLAERAKSRITGEPNPTTLRFERFKNALLTPTAPGQTPAWNPAILGNSPTATRHTLHQAIEDHFAHPTTDPTERAIRDTIKTYLQTCLADLVEHAFLVQVHDPQNRVLADAIQHLQTTIHTQLLIQLIDTFNKTHLGEVKLKRVSHLQWGAHTANVDILIADPQRIPALEQNLPFRASAQAIFHTHHQILILDRGLKGKSYLAGLLMESLPGDPLVVMLAKSTPIPPPLDFLAGQDVILFIDDFHTTAQTLKPSGWYDALSAIAATVSVIIVSRSGPVWDDPLHGAKKEAKPFLGLLHDEREITFEIPELTFTEGRVLADALGLDDSWITRWDGTIGSLRIDLRHRAEEYLTLRTIKEGSADATCLLDTVKALHRFRIANPQEALVRHITQNIIVGATLTNRQWQEIQRHTTAMDFGTFDESGRYRVHESYLDDHTIPTSGGAATGVIPYDPTPDLPAIAEIVLTHDDPSALFYLGVAAHIDLRNLNIAERAFQQAMDRGHAGSGSNLGVLLEEQRRHSEAEVAYRWAMDREVVAAGANLGVLLGDQSRLPEAEAAWRWAMKREFVEAGLYLGILLENQNRLSEAEAAWRWSMDHGDVEAGANLGNLLWRQDRNSEAEDAFRWAKERGHVGAGYNLALLLQTQDRLAEAEKAYRWVMDRESAKAGSNLGILLERQDRLPEAEAAYRWAMELDHATAGFNLGHLLTRQNRLSEAEIAYRWAMERGHTKAGCNLGILLKQQGRLPEAETAWAKAIDLGDAEAGYGLGILLHEQNRLPEAEVAWRWAMDQGVAEAGFNLGLLLEEQNRLSDAETAWRTSLDLGHAAAAFNLGLLLEAQNRRPEAEDAYQQSIPLFRQARNWAGEADALNLIGLLNYDAGDAESALQRFTEAAHRYHAASNPGEAIPLSNLGLARLALGREPAATQAYRAALTLFTQSANTIGITWCLQGLSAAALARGDAPLASQLAAVTDRMTQAQIDPPAPEQQRRADALLAPVRARRSNPAIAAAWLAAQSLTNEAAIAIALGS